MLLILGIVTYYIVNFAIYIYTSVQQISAKAIERSDYTKITTPLPAGVLMISVWNLDWAQMIGVAKAGLWSMDQIFSLI